jgi:Domain of unknown function (DUF5615)
VRVLLDESLPRRLGRELTAHDVRTVPEQGWAGLRNSELLRRAVAEGFEVFVTADQNLEHQQNLQRLDLAVVVVASRTNRLEDLRPLIPGILRAIPAVGRGEVVRVGE